MAEQRSAVPAGERGRLGGVFYASVSLSVAFLVAGIVVPGFLTDALVDIRQFVVDTFGIGYVLTVLAALVLLLALAVSPFGRRRLGRDDERPEFGWMSWVAMLFSAGVGLSFLFWGTAEPLIHLADPPHGATAPMSEDAGIAGLRYSFLFWGFHAWATYGVVAIAVGYSSFRHGRPVLISAALHPLLGDRVYGRLGKVIDVVAVFAILFGVATSLGLGTRELNAGLTYAFDVADSYGVKIAIIAGLMTVATISALTGLGRGIRILSLVNLTLCATLLIFVLVSGPTGQLASIFGDSVSGYATHLGPMSVATDGGGHTSWDEAWTFFFWAWWISWAPFVGTFIARISRGRSIRSVVGGVVLVPGLVAIAWFSVFGGTALQREHAGDVAVAAVAGDTKAVATFEVFGTLPLPHLTAVVVVMVLALLFITSADSASFMLGSTTTGGSLKPPRPVRLMWSFAAAFAAVLLLNGGIASLQGAAVVAAVPFTVILLLLAVSLVLSLVTTGRGGVPAGHTREC